MMVDLFSSDQRFEPLSLQGADVSILRSLQTHSSYMNILSTLLSQTKWRQQEMNMYGRRVLQPRLTAWYGDPGRNYLYSGIRNDAFPWTNLLGELKRLVEECTSLSFNSVLLNLYRDQNDSMGYHSDDEPELGPEPAIASLSFGATRTFLFKCKNQELPVVKVPLAEGTVLLMRGKTQRNWKHAINKEAKPCGPRVNLTFRRIYSADELDALRAAEFPPRRLATP